MTAQHPAAPKSEHAAVEVLRVLDLEGEGRDMVCARLRDAAARMANPSHRGNQHPWPVHARMFRDLAALLAEHTPEATEGERGCPRHPESSMSGDNCPVCRAAEPDAGDVEALGRDLTRKVLLHYGYELDTIVEAEQVHPGRVCSEEQCFDEETGDSKHGSIHDELGAMEAVMVDVVVPHVASLLAATADRARREGAAEAGRVAAAQRRAFYDEGVAHGRAEGAAEAGDRIAQAIEAEREKWAARFPVPEGWDLDYILRRDGTYSGLDRAARIARSTP